MSRLIVKNLPKHMKEERLKKIFSEKGTVTDCRLKYSPDGAFRRFAFIGFRTGPEAELALQHFHNTYIDTSKIQVDIAKNLGDQISTRTRSSKPVWGPTANTGDKPGETSKTTSSDRPKRKEGKKGPAALTEYEELSKDEKFQEFMAAHLPKVKTNTWQNDTFSTNESKTDDKKTVKSKSKESTDHGDSSTRVDQDVNASRVELEENEAEIKKKYTEKSNKKDLSDRDYLKSKLSKSSGDPSESADPSEQQDEHNGHIVKMRGLPFSVKKKDIEEFFPGFQLRSIRIPKGPGGKRKGVAIVKFSTSQDMKRALDRNGAYMSGRYIELLAVDPTSSPPTSPKKSTSDDAPTESMDVEPSHNAHPAPVNHAPSSSDAPPDDTESVSESGRLFVRNLPYCCTETDLDELFNQYGTLTELHLPVDKRTDKLMGFAFITFMFPEHAVKAFAELDGSVFQGRMLHIIPGHAKKSLTEDTYVPKLGPSAMTSFKKEKDAKMKAGTENSWNSLFIGADAVADVMTEKFDLKKSEVLDSSTRQSVPVRLALGETQIVNETRKFLTDNHVCLDAFSQPAAPRSKTVILVKNIPAGTQSDDIFNIFKRVAKPVRVVLPPSGVSALCKFSNSADAKKAFTTLAYVKFEHIPLYLEWAPVNVFTDAATQVDSGAKVDSEVDSGEKNAPAEEVESVSGCTLFVKNLNFSTTEDGLRELFSRCGDIRSVSIATKKHGKTGALLSMGYGFVEFVDEKGAVQALKQLQHSKLDDHDLELKISERATKKSAAEAAARKNQSEKKQVSTKILVRNVPFEATAKEVRELFRTFGELKSVRLPKKAASSGNHRGFGFVDFLTKNDAKRAFETLCHSTHLLGRRLVLEWADSEETVEDLRKKTALHYHDEIPKKRTKMDKMMEDLDNADDIGED